MVRFCNLFFISVWIALIFITSASEDPKDLDEWVSKFDQQNYPGGNYYINTENHDQIKIFFSCNQLKNDKKIIDFGTTIIEDPDQVALTDIKIWKGVIQTDVWTPGRTFAEETAFGMIIGKHCEDPDNCNWYVIEEYDDESKKIQVHLKKYEYQHEYKPGFYFRDRSVYTGKNRFYTQPDFENADLKDDDYTYVSYPLYIQEIKSVDQIKQIFILGKAIDENWYLIQVVGKSPSDTKTEISEGPKLSLFKKVDISKLEQDIYALENELNATNTALNTLQVQYDTATQIFNNEQKTFESQKWYMKFIIGFLGGLLLVSSYFLYYYFMERFTNEEEDDEGQEFNIGDKVNVRNTQKQEWRIGRVVQVKPVVKVLADNWQQEYEWKFVEHYVPSTFEPNKLQKKDSQLKVLLISPPKDILPKPKKVTKPRTIIIHPDDEEIDAWHNPKEENQEPVIPSPNPTLSKIISADFSSLASTLSDITTMSYFSTNFTVPNLTEELTNQRVSSDSLPAISDVTVSSSLKH